MHFQLPVLLLAASASCRRISHHVPYTGNAPDMILPASDAAGKAYVDGLQKTYLRNIFKQLSSTCNMHNIRIRQAWEDLPKSTQQDYLRAVNCLADQPTRLDKTIVPGARNWVDDFAWAHISQTNYIHESALLLPWHRQFIFAYEESLINTCNYTGALPYWDWARHAYNQSASPVIQADSFGRDGLYIPHEATNDSLVGLPITLFQPAGTGGGCITNGAFANWTLNIGHVSPINNSFTGSHNTLYPNNTLGQQYQPRCIRRSFVQEDSTVGLNYTNLALVMQQSDISTFHPLLENSGVHGNGHGFVGGDMSDLYASPNDPTFFLHHAQIDRMWTIWQGQDFKNRGEALDGTLTFSNIPPSPNGTLESIMEMGVAAGGSIPIGKAMSATQNGYCYLYI